MRYLNINLILMFSDSTSMMCYTRHFVCLLSFIPIWTPPKEILPFCEGEHWGQRPINWPRVWKLLGIQRRLGLQGPLTVHPHEAVAQEVPVGSPLSLSQVPSPLLCALTAACTVFPALPSHSQKLLFLHSCVRLLSPNGDKFYTGSCCDREGTVSGSSSDVMHYLLCTTSCFSWSKIPGSVLCCRAHALCTILYFSGSPPFQKAQNSLAGGDSLLTNDAVIHRPTFNDLNSPRGITSLL
jgi:hypothetical protein